MEISIPPIASLPPPRFAANYESRDLPSVPTRNPRRSQIWNDVTRTWETVIAESPSSSPHNVGNSTIQPTPTPPRSPTFQLLPSPRSLAFRQQAPSPTPPMTKSSQKILQLTGFDPRFERVLPLEHQQLSPSLPTRPQLPHSPIRSISSNSSGSFYSQAEVSFRSEHAGSPKDSSVSLAQSSNSEGEYLTSSIYNTSEHSSTISQTSKQKMKTRSNNEKLAPPPAPKPEIAPQVQPQPGEEPLPLPRFPTSSQKSRDSNEIITLPEILAQEQLPYEKGFEKDTRSTYKHTMPLTPSLVPSALTMKPKHPNLITNAVPKAKEGAKPKHITVVGKKTPSLFRSAIDSLEWGIYDPSTPSPNSNSPSRSRYPTTPVSPMFSMESDHLTLSPPLGSSFPSSLETPKTRRRRFGSGSKHPLKSPFPFTKTARESATAEEDEELDSMPSPSTSRTFKRRVTSTLKHLSPTSPSSSGDSKSSPPSSRKFVIANGARRVDGPATPVPPKHGFMEGVMRGKEVLGMVVGMGGGGGGGMTREEKRRESLKKRIVVVRITDQSPDGRVAEWL
ncbi:hypothetical protein BKA65DRAFT_590587 [Rhexocercosporidium sp. MPI-PUGE-AT-0058]|nr:hypothetical protein BKA65DRAFT_590587 [Rhexocercosporidium sp. MPI-PUGE-AT-0058]